MSTRFPVRFATLALLGCFIVAELAAKANRVAVRAEATREYTIARAREEASKVQTYHLIKGKYFGGNVHDPGLEEVSFEQIAGEIAVNLKRQNYHGPLRSIPFYRRS